MFCRTVLYTPLFPGRNLTWLCSRSFPSKAIWKLTGNSYANNVSITFFVMQTPFVVNWTDINFPRSLHSIEALSRIFKTTFLKYSKGSPPKKDMSMASNVSELTTLLTNFNHVVYSRVIHNATF